MNDIFKLAAALAILFVQGTLLAVVWCIVLDYRVRREQRQRTEKSTLTKLDRDLPAVEWLG